MKPSMGLTALAAAILTFAPARVARADEAADQQFKIHVQHAKIHYDLGEFADAAEEYIQAYRIKPVAGALFNIAQAYRQAGQYEKSRQFYNSYLRDANPIYDAKAKAIVQKQIKELDELRSRRRSVQSTPRPPTSSRLAVTSWCHLLLLVRWRRPPRRARPSPPRWSRRSRRARRRWSRLRAPPPRNRARLPRKWPSSIRIRSPRLPQRPSRSPRRPPRFDRPARVVARGRRPQLSYARRMSPAVRRCCCSAAESSFNIEAARADSELHRRSAHHRRQPTRMISTQQDRSHRQRGALSLRAPRPRGGRGVCSISCPRPARAAAPADRSAATSDVAKIRFTLSLQSRSSPCRAPSLARHEAPDAPSLHRSFR